MAKPLFSLKPPSISWNDLDEPINTQFEDCYLFTEDGRDEAWYNYIEGNNLEQRFSELNAGDPFVVAETGFGTGLNFLNCLKCFSVHANPDAQLHFYSSELYPLTADMIRRALAPYSDYADQIERLCKKLPPPIPGVYRLHFGNVALTLMYGDSFACYEQLRTTSHPLAVESNQFVVDAWFLDGFAPSRNPEQFSEDMLSMAASFCKPGSTLTTFSVAAAIKKPLVKFGFKLNKRSGYSLKREMLCATYDGKAHHHYTHNSDPCPWWAYRSQPKPDSDSLIVVIGAGIAGSMMAYKLANLGYQVLVIEQGHEAATLGSGNSQGAIYGKLSNTTQALNQLVIGSQIYSARLYRELLADQPELGHECGMIQIPSLERDHGMQQLVAEHLAGCDSYVRPISKDEASSIAGVPVADGGLFFGESWWLAPKALCAWLLQHDNISVKFNTRVESIHSFDSSSHELSLSSGDKINASQVVICCAQHTRHLRPELSSALRTVAGQTTEFKHHELSKLKTIVCAEAYVPPASNGKMITGASFHPNQEHISLSDEDHNHNLNKLAGLFDQNTVLPTDVEIEGGHAAIRCATRDYLPLVGAAPNTANLSDTFARLKDNKNAKIDALGDYDEGIWILAGLGSRGLSYAPLCAEILVSAMTSQPPPVGRELCQALSPARFIVRSIIRANAN